MTNGGFAQQQPQSAALSVIYQGDKVQVSKDRFVIGRGKQSSDLTLKDPNVSRQHAMIEFQNGVYFMVDMGSTNGVEFNGQRIARKQIAEGDVFRICDHDLRFTYRGGGLIEFPFDHDFLCGGSCGDRISVRRRGCGAYVAPRRALAVSR